MLGQSDQSGSDRDAALIVRPDAIVERLLQTVNTLIFVSERKISLAEPGQQVRIIGRERAGRLLRDQSLRELAPRVVAVREIAELVNGLRGIAVSVVVFGKAGSQRDVL